MSDKTIISNKTQIKYQNISKVINRMWFQISSQLYAQIQITANLQFSDQIWGQIYTSIRNKIRQNRV